MSDQDITLELKERKTLGKGLNKLRKEGLIPAVIHDHGKPSTHVMGEYGSVVKVFANAGKHHPVEITVGTIKNTVIIKDVHFNSVKNRVDHVVFQAIRQDETIETEVPIVLVGEIPAEKTGLMVITHLSTVQAEALPKNLPDNIELNVSTLIEIGDKLTVADLTPLKDVTILTEPEGLIISVEETKAQLSEETAEAETETTAEDKTKESSEKE